MYEFKESDAYDFARHVGIQAKNKGSELMFLICPYCNGGANRKDKGTFSINLKTGQYKCLRASCGVSGNMITLAKDFDFSLGQQADEYYRPRKKYRTLKTPEKPIVPKSEAVTYLESRGISEEVAKEYEITTWNNKPNILVFPFYDEKGKMQFVKYRKTDFDKTKDKNKEWCEADCKPILFGMKQCKDFTRLIVCEGQIDSLSVSTSGINNAVSVPTGAQGFTWLPYCWNWINKFEEVIVFGDYENGKMSLLEELSRRLKTKVKHVRYEDYKDCKDANEILKKYGAEQVRQCIENAIVVPMKRVIDLADVEDVDIFEIPKLATGINQIDKLLYGGLPAGGVIIIQGKPGEGKLLADNTPVFTRNGWKKHGDLVVGDEVIGRNGEFVKVTHVFPKGNANMKVTFNNNEVIYCHENHEWVMDLHYQNSYKEKIMETNELFEKKESGYTHPLRLIDRAPMRGIDVELHVKPYTLGAWLGDGRTSNPDVCSSKQDYCIIERIKDDGYEISWQTTHKDTGVIYTGFKGLRQQLKKYGMCNSRQNKGKKIPFEYLIAPLTERLELLAGLLDTDGYYDKEKNSYSFATTEIAIRDSFMDLISTFGWNYYCSLYKAKTSSSGIVGRKDVYVIGFVPIGLYIPCQVERKRQKMIKQHSKRRTSIRKIERCENIQGNCIQVEGGIYCVGRKMIPTHNSTLASQILINSLEQNHRCFAYSGELPNYLFKSWIDFQIAGPYHVTDFENRWGDKGYRVSKTNKAEIAAWYRDRCFLYDNSIIDGDEKESLITTTENVIMQYGVDVVLLDNLMTAIDLEESRGSDKYERQSLFVKKLARMALRHGAWIILVAHKRKNNFSTNENDETSGSADIINLASIVISYGKDSEISESQRLCKVSKNRVFGKTCTTGYTLNYDERSKRIYGDGDNLHKEYGWYKGDGFVVPNEETPFN